MTITKTIFEALDKLFNKKINENVKIDGDEHVIITKDIVYSKQNKSICTLDYYYVPKNSNSKYPVVFNIHGGGFVAGGKEYRTKFCTWLAVHGFFVVNVNYGLSPEFKFPEPVLHLIKATNWIYNHSKIFNLDKSKIVFCGDSAGAYYASILTCIYFDKHMQVVFNSRPKIKPCACILNCGIYDINLAINSPMLLNLNHKIFEDYTGISIDNLNMYAYKDYCSPINFINKKFPQTCLIYAEKDILCKGQTEKLIEKFHQYNISYQSYKSKSLFANHCFSLEWTSKQAQEANKLILDFLEKIK